jgi:ATP-dependent helicase/DNAse subunit B
MHRYILSELPQFDTSHHQFQIITPSKAIALKLKVPHYSLESLGQNIIRQQGLRIASALLSRRLLQDVVREVVKNRDIEGTARSFLPTIRELFRSGVDLKPLQKSASPRVKQLADLALAYQQQLHSKKYLDGAELFWQASKILTDSSTAYLFYGYFLARPDEIAFIDAVAGNNSIFISPEVSLEAEKSLVFLREKGWQVLKDQGQKVSNLGRELQRCFLQPQPLHNGVVLHTYDNLEAEVRGVLTQVKTLLNRGIKAQEIVLVTREETLYGETLIDIAWEYKLTVRALYEIPLEQTRFGAWLKLLLEVIESDFPFEATAKLLAHPLARLMSAETWAQAREIKPNNRESWHKLGIDLSLLNFTKNKLRRELWVKRLQDILTSWDILEKGKRWAREIVAFYRFQEALVELGKPSVNISAKTFIQDIKDTLALLTVPVQPGRGGVQLHTPASLLGTTYQYVFVLGVAEGILPVAIADDPVLDFFARKQLSRQGFPVETAKEIARREAAYFYHLLAIPTKKITFSYPQLISKNPVLPSPYLTRLQLQPQSLPNLPIVSIETARQIYLPQAELLNDPLMPQISHAWQVQLSRENHTQADEYNGLVGIKIPPESKIFSASQLTQLGQCPFKWFASHLLKLKELTEAELDLSTKFRGNLYHRCLELSLENIKTAQDLETFNRQQLEQAFIQAETELQLTQISGWDAQREEHLALLSLNLSTKEFLPPGREVFKRETEFSTQWHGLQIKGTVDRIDRNSQGLTIIDYKTSSTAPAGIKDATGKASLDIQLSLYIDAIAKIYPQESITQAAYYSLTGRKTMSRPKTNPEDLAAFAQQVKSHLETGYYPVAPDIEQKACKYCSFDSVCRKNIK